MSFIGQYDLKIQAENVIKVRLVTLKLMDSFIRTIYINDTTWVAVMQKGTIVFAIEEI